jgi:hypothetical protein
MTTTTAFTEPRSWETRRSAFRHDWLKNTYLNRLDGFLSGLDAANPDLEWLLEFVEEDLPAWEERKGEARWVIDAYEDEMSPRTLFARPPLSRCAPEKKRWLGNLVHELWRSRYDTTETTEKARKALNDANRKYDQLADEIEGTPDAARLQALRPQFEAFKKACVALGDAMSNFLREVRPT